MTEPHDLFAEAAVLGSCLTAGKVPAEVVTVISPQDFYRPAHQEVAEAAWDLTARESPCDPVSVRTELLRRGSRSGATDGAYLHDLVRQASPGTLHHARTVRDLSVRRDLIVNANRLIQQAENPTADPYDLAASAMTHFATLSERDMVRSKHLETVHEFVAGPSEFDWLVPGLLERGDRLLLTAAEGSGKSRLCQQLAVTVAAGLHPFTHRQLKPLPVLMIDLENGTRHLRRSMRPLLEQAWRDGRAVPERGLFVESLPAGVDVTQPDGEAWLLDLCEQAQPALVVIGSMYRMHAADMSKEEPARHLTRVLDTIRSRYDCALVVETHAPHAGVNGRSLRPVGSSLFMRWPEYGMGISPAKEEGVFFLRPWRGARDERDWPSRLAWGGPGRWPWVIYRDPGWADEEEAS